jgi:hypothetical protein
MSDVSAEYREADHIRNLTHQIDRFSLAMMPWIA